MKYLLVDLSGKVDNYDKALYQALEKELSNEKSSIQLLIPGHGLIRLIPNKFSQTEFIVKRLIKALEGGINYIYLLLHVAFKKIDTIHFQWLPFVEVVGIEKYILYLLHVLSPQTKVILTIHNIYPHGVKSMSDSGKQKYKKRFRDTCRNIDNIIVHTESSKMEVIKEFDFVPDIISIVHHGVFIPKIRISKKEFLQKNKYVILQFGLQTYYKGTDILVDAVNLLPAEYSEKIETRIVGGVGESYLQELKGKDSNSLIHWKSYFLSNDELYEEINNSDVLVLPYREISQSGVLLLSIAIEITILHELGILYRSMQNLSEAERYFLAAYEKETDEEKKYMECLSLGYLYMQMGQTENARKYLMMSANSSKAYTQISAYDCLYFLEKDIDNFEEAIVYHELADSITNAMEELNSRELIASLQKKYENEKLRNDNLQMKVRYTNFILWGTIAFLFVVACMCYYYYKNRNNKKKIAEIELQIQENEEEIERYQQEIEDIQISKDQVLKENLVLEENRTKVGELNGKIVLLTMQNKTLSEHLKALGGELNVGISSGSFIHAFRLLLAIKEGTLRGKLSNEERQKLFSLFDLIYWNYVSRLLERAPTLTKHDLEICCFLKFGLSHEELSCIFHTTSDSVTRAKGRLKGRLGISPQDDLDLFLKEF